MKLPCHRHLFTGSPTDPGTRLMLGFYTIRASAAAAATRVFAVHLKPVPDENKRTCMRVNVRAHVRGEKERDGRGDESRRRYNTEARKVA